MPRLRIEIDGSLFSALSNEEKEKITGILKNTNLLSKDGTFEKSSSSTIADAQTVIADPQGFFDDLIDRVNVCKIGCNVAAAAAVAACEAATVGVGLAACLAAASVAREACLDEC